VGAQTERGEHGDEESVGGRGEGGSTAIQLVPGQFPFLRNAENGH